MTGEHLSPDIKALLRALSKHRVRYLIVGGEAVIHHGYPRLTGDIDLFFDRAEDNTRRLFAALREFWRGDVPALESARDLTEPEIVVQFGVAPNRIDLLSALGPIPFARAWRRRVVETLTYRRQGIPVYFIGLDDLLEAKRHAGRHKDLDDIEHLEPSRRRRARTKPRSRR